MIIYLLLRFVAFLIGLTSERAKIHAQFVPEWTSGLYIAVGVLALFWFAVPDNDNPRYPVAARFAVFGMVVGLVIGLVHGAMRASSSPPIPTDSSQAKEIKEDGNPYRPS